jgi:hypothetical protein
VLRRPALASQALLVVFLLGGLAHPSLPVRRLVARSVPAQPPSPVRFPGADGARAARVTGHGTLPLLHAPAHLLA